MICPVSALPTLWLKTYFTTTMWWNIYFLNGGLRKVVVKNFQCVKFIFLTTHERTFQPSLRGVENLVSKWSEK
jgi:hypothetical protein